MILREGRGVNGLLEVVKGAARGGGRGCSRLEGKSAIDTLSSHK